MASRQYVKGLAECTGGCGRLTRPSISRAAQFNVKTWKRFGGGLCLSCHTEHNKPAHAVRPSEAAVRECFESFIRSRRNRGIPEEGIQLRTAS